MNLRDRAVSVTADDWGMSPAINHAILDLARQGLVSRVSMMSDGRYLLDDLDELLAIGHLDFGLHFDLTHGSSKRLFPWFTASREELKREFDRQLTALETIGVKVTYIDGHQHVHLLPRIISALKETLRERGIRETRIPFDRKQWISRRPFLNWLCLYAKIELGSEFESRPCVYPRLADFENRERLAKRLSEKPNAEFIVHPAVRDDLTELGIEDSYKSERVREYRLLRELTYEAGC